MLVSGGRLGRSERAVKPSAQPTLVRTQHLPPPAQTARDRGILPLLRPSCVVSSCVIVGQQTSLCGSGYGHMADGFGAGGAVHRTACFLGRGSHPAGDGLLRLERSPVIPGRPAPVARSARKARAAHPDRRAEVPLERAAEAAGGSPRRLVQGGGPHRVRVARPAVTDPLPVGPTPVTGNGPSVYLRRTRRVPRRSAQVSVGIRFR